MAIEDTDFLNSIMVAVCVTENAIITRVEFFFTNTLLSPPSLHRFSRNIGTRRSFVNNRKLSLYI